MQTRPGVVGSLKSWSPGDTKQTRPQLDTGFRAEGLKAQMSNQALMSCRASHSMYITVYVTIKLPGARTGWLDSAEGSRTFSLLYRCPAHPQHGHLGKAKHSDTHRQSQPFGRLRQGDSKLKTIVDNVMKPCLKQNEKD